MDHASQLLALGAEVVAGTMYLNRKEVGKFAHGQFTLYPEGEAALEAARPEEPQQLPEDRPAPKARAKTKAPAIDVTADLGDLLNDGA